MLQIYSTISACVWDVDNNQDTIQDTYKFRYQHKLPQMIGPYLTWTFYIAARYSRVL